MEPTSSDLQDVQSYLVSKFTSWRPTAPVVLCRRHTDLTLDWSQELFHFLGDQLIYRLEKNDKIPKWVVVYSGGQVSKRIHDLAPRYPHRFRVKVILKATAVPLLAELAVKHYGDVDTVYEKMEELSREIEEKETQDSKSKSSIEITGSGKGSFEVKSETDSNNELKLEEQRKKLENIRQVVEAIKLAETKKRLESGTSKNGSVRREGGAWLESLYSGETWTNTSAGGTSPVCFGMAVRCGYLKQVQAMAEERPDLLEIVNSTTGHTPLATAVRKGDINTVKLLLSLGAAVSQPSLAGHTPLQLAVLAARVPLVSLLLDKGADLKARDCNGLRAEHYAVDSCSLEMLRYILDRGGDVRATDNNGWTPLFRAVCQGATSAVVEELVRRGSELDVVDGAGLPLVSAAKLLTNRHGRPRDSVIRLVDTQYPREKALAHFTRISRKIHHVHTLLRIN